MLPRADICHRPLQELNLPIIIPPFCFGCKGKDNLKDNLINYGLKDGIKKSINSVIETGKEAIGIISGNFENIGQIQKVIKNGGLIDKIDNFLDKTLDKAINSGKINQTIGKIVKTGKSSILSNVERNIESTLNSQVENSKNIEKYMNNWKKYFNDRNFSGMEKEYTKLEKELKSLVPIETTIKNARYIENIHKLIKNNGQNFELSERELELANKI